VPWRGIGVDHTGGTLDHPSRVAIHLTHRLGALVTTMVLGGVAAAVILRARQTAARRAAWAVVLALAAQVTLGIAMIRLGLPLALAVAHNATAALLLLGLVTMNPRLWRTG
jgi:cytochrome c oxidase assembly protein subunit 15